VEGVGERDERVWVGWGKEMRGSGGRERGDPPALWDSLWDPDCNILSLSLSLSPSLNSTREGAEM